MAVANLSNFLRRLTRQMGAESLADQSDRQLVERALAGHDEAAFESMVHRHGAMVYRVCWRVLQHPQDAEDAFQATFLILAQKLRTLRKHASLASWLHGIAHRVSVRARTQSGTRRRRESLAPPADSIPPDDMKWKELRSVLDAELDHLPDKWRLPLILCYLEGRTQDEAAGQLGWSKSTLRRRLDQARDALSHRLTGRGIVWPAALSAVLLSDCIALAAPAPALVAVTVEAAAVVVAGKAAATAASAQVAALTEGVLESMLPTKLKIATVVLFVMSVVASSAGMLVYRDLPAASSRAEEKNQPFRKADVRDRIDGKDGVPAAEKPRLDRFGDPLPAGAIARLGTLRFRHPFWVSALAYTPDEKTLASVSWDSVVRLWDPATGMETRSFRGATRNAFLSRVAITPDGKSLIAMESHQFVHIWDLATGKEVRKLTGGDGFGLALAPGGKTLAKGLSGGRLMQISLWDLETGELLRTLGARDRYTYALAFSPDGKLLAAGDGPPIGAEEKVDSSCIVRLWEPTKGQVVRELKGHTGGITSVAFSPVAKLLASASHDASIRLWNSGDGKLVRTIAVPEDAYPAQPDLAKGVHYGGVKIVTFAPDGRWVASGGHDGSVRVWETDTGKPLHTMRGHGREVTSLIFSRDGKVLTSGSFDHTIRRWDPSTGREIQARDGHDGPVSSIAVSPDGQLAAAVCQDRSIHLWSLLTGKQQCILRGHTDAIHAVAFSPDGRALASASSDQTIRIWDVATGREERQLKGHLGDVYTVAFTPGDNMLLSGGRDRTLRFWDWSKGKELRQIATGGLVVRLTLSRDGRIVAHGRTLRAQSIFFRDVASGKELRRTLRFAHVALTPDGQSYLTHSENGMIQLRDLGTDEEQLSFAGPQYPAGAVEFLRVILSPDGRLFATTTGTDITVWELATGKVRRHFSGHRGNIGSFAFTPEGRALLTGGDDTTILIWDFSRRQESRPDRLSPADLESLWGDLRGDDAERADRAICTLAARSAQTVPFLAEHLALMKSPDAKRVAALISDLDSGAFPVREKAAKELEVLREQAWPSLQQALGQARNLETRRRIESLLASQRQPLAASDLLRSIRAVEVLERIDSPESRTLLKKLTEGAPDARFTGEARKALARIKKQ